MVCNKRGINNNKCQGKAPYFIESGKVEIYEKCINNNKLHNPITLEKFKELYINDNLKKKVYYKNISSINYKILINI